MKRVMALFIAALMLALSSAAMAHTPLCTCYQNGDGTVTCEGGFSDGSSAAGVTMRVKDASGKELLSGAVNDSNEFTFKKPSGDYSVEFDAGEGHRVVVEGKNIVE